MRIPSHCDLLRNEKAEEHAKHGSLIVQADTTISFAEEKTLLNRKMKQKWKQEQQGDLDDAREITAV